MALVLTRNFGEATLIQLGGVTVKVVPTKGRGQSQVRLAFICPKSVVILREEALEKQGSAALEQARTVIRSSGPIPADPPADPAYSRTEAPAGPPPRVTVEDRPVDRPRVIPAAEVKRPAPFDPPKPKRTEPLSASIGDMLLAQREEAEARRRAKLARRDCRACGRVIEACTC